MYWTRSGPRLFTSTAAQKISNNYAGYQDALKKFAGVVSYAVKANGNIHILKRLRQLGSWATLVSGNELLLALAAGFEPNQLIFNGNGKTLPELRLAIEHGVLINLDSDFDLKHIGQLSETMDRTVKTLIRINPDIDPGVHPYISTGLRKSKFGLRPDKIPAVLKRIGEFPNLHLVGLHCHLGSTITDLEVFRQMMVLMVQYFEEIRAGGYPLKYLNLGGGLGIDYNREGGDFPTPDQLVEIIADKVPVGATLILEPGRSIVGDAGGLVCRVIGVKKTVSKNFIVIDGSMAEFIRPSLYQADHKIGFLQPIAGPSMPFDIVGPVCRIRRYSGARSGAAHPSGGNRGFHIRHRCIWLRHEFQLQCQNPPTRVLDRRRAGDSDPPW